MARKNSKQSRFLEKYAAWRNGLPRGWRIVFDVVSTALVIGFALYAFVLALMVFIPILILIGLARGGGHGRSSDQQWDDDNDPRGNGPRGTAPEYFD